MKINIHKMTGMIIALVLLVSPYFANAAHTTDKQPFCKKHKVPCTLKHLCISFDNNNARLYYNDGEYYNYKHQGKFYNYIHQGKFFAFFENGTFFNYQVDGKYYTNCVQQPGYWQQNEWIVPPPVCK